MTAIQPTRRTNAWRPPSLAIALAIPDLAVLVAAFLPWTESDRRATGAPAGLLAVVMLSVMASAALAAQHTKRVFRVLGLLSLAYAWTCMASAARFSSSAALRLAAGTEASGGGLVFRAGFYVATAGLTAASAGWVAVMAHAWRNRACHRPAR